MKQIITCASYGGTGSSAITDILLEFDNIKGIKEFEFTIAHDVDGINALEYGLVENWNRLNNDEYLYRFIKLINRISPSYIKYFGQEFKNVTENYIKSLVNLEWNGYWHQHKYRYDFLQRKIRFDLPNKIMRLVGSLQKREYEYVPKQKLDNIYFSRVSEEQFLNKTKKYFNDLMDLLDRENSYKYVALDQLIPSNNINRYIRYFSDIKVVLVDRDPRDLYILNKKFWKEGWIPSENIDDYVEWYKILRQERSKELQNSNVLFIQFEDLIFSYEETLKVILNFLGLSEENHVNKKLYFNPEVSRKNIKLFDKFPEYKDDILIIENKLYDYCYFK